MMSDLSSRVSIIAVGVSHYIDQNFIDLTGPQYDLENLKWILIENSETALFDPTQYLELSDPESQDLRNAINEFIVNRPPESDILIFYFSGHGVPIGLDDFGFCTSDSIIHPETGITLPLSVVKFSELLESVTIGNIIPVVIIDACYSGIAGKQLTIPSIDAISNLEHKVHSASASCYALMCSCSANQTTIDSTIGGIFSHILFDIASEGFSVVECNKPLLTLADLFPSISKRISTLTGDITPRLYLGQTLPDFPIVRNVQFSSRRYSLSPTYIDILVALWNNGNERDLSPSEIGSICSYGAYCNHNKLSFPPWQLVETIPNTRRRRLTNRGRQFILGNLEVVKTVVQDPQSNDFIPAENSPFVRFHDFFQTPL